MPDTVNLASRYAKQVDEAFTRGAQASFVTNNSYTFNGEHTVVVYSIPAVDLVDYQRTGSNRYGSPGELTNTIQELTVEQDKAFTFTIDKGNKVQSAMVMDAGQALARQLREKVIPFIDKYVFEKIARAASANSATASTTVTKDNAYKLLLDGQQMLGDACVPDSGRVALCSYKFANFLKQDPAFIRYGDSSQRMLERGSIGTVDGTRIVLVPASRLPAGCSFILAHPSATVLAKQLSEYKIHENPQGISGWLVEGRVLFDAWVLNQKAGACYYHGAALSSPTP